MLFNYGILFARFLSSVLFAITVTDNAYQMSALFPVHVLMG